MRPPATEKPREKAAEFSIYAVENLTQALSAFAVQMADGTAQLGDRIHHLITIMRDLADAFFNLRNFDIRTQIDRTHFIAFADKAFHLAPRLVFRNVRKFFRCRRQFRALTKSFGDARRNSG